MDSVTYKPGFKYSISDIGQGCIMVKLGFLVQDAIHPSKPLDYGYSSFIVNEFLDIQQESETLLLFKLENAIRSFERHEIDEFLKINGVNVHEPHPLDKSGQ
jgi:hypothetical protein